jgi:hypothetical protein
MYSLQVLYYYVLVLSPFSSLAIQQQTKCHHFVLYGEIGTDTVCMHVRAHTRTCEVLEQFSLWGNSSVASTMFTCCSSCIYSSLCCTLAFDNVAMFHHVTNNQPQRPHELDAYFSTLLRKMWIFYEPCDTWHSVEGRRAQTVQLVSQNSSRILVN